MTPNHLYFLPQDILEQIFVKIPSILSIVRCTSVCKTWYILIKSSWFISSHLSHPNKTKFLFSEALRFDGEFSCTYSIYNDTEPKFDEAYKLVLPKRVKHILLHGCCNGVICYTKHCKYYKCYKSYTDRGTIFLWNPSIKKLKELPKYRNPDHVNSVIGFWFNIQTNDYEVVRIAYSLKSTSVDVYTLSSNSWRIISETCPGTPFWVENKNLVYADGTLHWLAKRDHDWEIVSLNMNTGKFRETVMSWCSSADFLFRTTGDQSLAIFGKVHQLDWEVVKVYDIESLSILYTIDVGLRDGPAAPVGFRNNGEALLRKHIPDPMEMMLCNIDTKRSKDVDLSRRSFHWVRPFVESLVLLDK